jgi:hypothetical protein
MSVFDNLKRQGRDPLEALLVPPAPDVAKWLEEDENAKLDHKIAAELSQWNPEMRTRLYNLVKASLEKYAAQPTQPVGEADE